GQFFFGRQPAQGASLENRLCQGLLAKAMLAKFHGTRSSLAVIVVRSGNCYRIDLIANFIEYLPIILKAFSLRELLAFLIERVLVHIIQCDDIGTAFRCVIAVAVAFPSSANAGKVNAVVSAQNSSYKRKTERRGTRGHRGALDEVTAR